MVGVNFWKPSKTTGCAMGRNTPLENVQALVAAARNFGTHDQIMAIES
jgi:hypothetical protein